MMRRIFNRATSQRLCTHCWENFQQYLPGRVAPSSKGFATSAHLRQLTGFQTQKVLFEFDNLYDRNQDGFIDKKDIQKIKRELLEYVADSQGQVMKDGYGPGFDGYWTLFNELADDNRDGRLSREEWVEMWGKISETARDVSFLSLPQWVRLMPNCMFPIIDTKGDGLLDIEEYSNFWFKLSLQAFPERSTIRHHYNTLTENGTHALTLSRFEDLYADFYLSTDPKTPGKYIAGPIKLDDN